MTLGIQRSLLIAFCSAVFFVQSSPEAVAFDLFGFSIFKDQASKDATAVIADPQNYHVDIAVTTDDGALEAGVRNASGLWAGRTKPASGAAGLLAVARADYRRIVAALYAQGYYGSSVSILVDGREANERAPDSKLAEDAAVNVNVNTGQQFRFGAVDIGNQAPRIDVTNDDGSSGALVILAQSGDIARTGAIKRTARLAIDAWRQQGHPKVKIVSQDIVVDHDRQLVDISIELEAGPKARFGSVSVEGAKDMIPDFVVRQSGLANGQDYHPQDIQRAKARLAKLDVFGSVKIEEGDVQADGTLPIKIIVQERKLRRAGAGATFSSTDGLGTEGFWQHRNLFGGAEHIRFDAKLSDIAFPLSAENFGYYVGATFSKPGVLTPDSELNVALSAQYAVLPRYTETSAQGTIGLSQTFSKTLSGEVGIGAARSQFTDTTFGSRDFTVWSTYGAVTLDTRDNATNATSGVYATLKAEPFYESSFGNAAVLLETEGRTYWGLGADDKFVLAGRLKVGLLLGPSIAQTPPDKLFFAGGGGSVRGYSFRSIGVATAGGSVTGGKFLTEASVEARVKITDDIGVVGFVDAGYVTAESFVGLDAGTRIGAGLGLRYNTGFGPIRLDVAVPINKRSGDPDYGIYVGIGQAF